LFILTLRKNRFFKRTAFILLIAVIIFVALAAAAVLSKKKKDTIEANGKTLNLIIRSPEDAEKAAAVLGIEADNAAVDCTKIVIPFHFNQVYNDYNQLQKCLGTDLFDYRGKECLKYTVSTDNTKEGGVTVTLLVFNECLIGGDISENRFQGSIRSLL